MRYLRMGLIECRHAEDEAPLLIGGAKEIASATRSRHLIRRTLGQARHQLPFPVPNATLRHCDWRPFPIWPCSDGGLCYAGQPQNARTQRGSLPHRAERLVCA